MFFLTPGFLCSLLCTDIGHLCPAQHRVGYEYDVAVLGLYLCLEEVYLGYLALHALDFYPLPDLEFLFAVHEELEDLINDMFSGYNQELNSFDENVDILEGLIGGLDRQKINLVTSDVIDKINSVGTAKIVLISEDALSLDREFNSIKFSFNVLRKQESTAKRIFDSENNDYLFISRIFNHNNSLLVTQLAYLILCPR